MNIKTHYVIHEHFRKAKRKIHWDIRIVRPGKRKVWSFAIPKARLPKKGEKLLVIRTIDHSMDIMNKEGTLKNKDTLKVIEQGECVIARYTPSHISMIFKGKIARGHYSFVLVEEDRWLLITAK